MDKTMYDNDFYQEVVNNNYPSAKAVAPIVRDLIHPRSVIDFGCGAGCWLKAFDECCDLEHMRGLEGEWLEGKPLLIPREHIEYFDLTKEYELPAGQKYDLAICLEVIEHIDEAGGENLLNSIVKASDAVLFSAAIPYQRGTHHINEQWQSHWAKKFAERHYVCLDLLRPVFWNDDNVKIYRQNMFLYVNKNRLSQYPGLQAYAGAGQMLDLVHPDLWDIATRDSKLFFTLSEWMDKELDGKHIADYLEERDIHEIAIYGMGHLGRILLKVLSGTEIRVKYVIDRAEKNIGQIPYFHMADDSLLPPVQAVVVTAINDFAAIEPKLKVKTDSRILDLKEIVSSL